MQRPAPLLGLGFVLMVTAVGIGRSQTPPGQGLPAPPLGRGTAQIGGQVTDARSHAPLPGTVVALNGRGVPPQRTIADTEGRFSFRDLPPGVITVLATHIGYFGGGDGRDATGPGRQVEVSNDQAVTDLALALWKLGAVSGTVVADGDPLVGTEVNALRRSLVASRWRYANVATTSTDDRGAYRLSGLLPGEYMIVARPDRDPETPLLLSLLAATPAASVDVLAAATAKGRGVPERDARVKTYPTTFFRNVLSSSTATVISIDAGADRQGVDFQMKAPRGVRVTGTVSGLDGPAEEMEVRLLRADSSLEVAPIDVAVAALESDGRFEFNGVPPGKYLVTMLSRPATGPPGPPPPPAPSPPPAGPTWWARMPITVGTAGTAGLKVPAHKGSIVRGHLDFAGRAMPTGPEIAQIIVQLVPETSTVPNASAWRAQVTPDGSFTTMGVPAGRYFMRVAAAPRGWTVESASVGARDVLDESLEIQSSDVDDVVLRFVDHPLGGINGMVHDDADAPVSNAMVLVFPAVREPGLDTAPQARRLRSVRSLSNGAFSAGGLPPGAYLAIALAASPAPDWQDPKRLDALAPKASPVAVGTGPSQPITLSIVKTSVRIPVEK